jgi:hypothetical protein
MKRTVVLAVVLAAAVQAGDAAAALLSVKARFEAPVVQFGDVIRTHVVVQLDSGSVRAGTLRIVDDTGPLTPLGAAHTTRTTRAGVLVIDVQGAYMCLSGSCVARNGDAMPALPPVRATAVTKSGQTLRATTRWPPLQIRGRVSAADLARSNPPFRADTTPPPATYRIAPSTLSGLLDALAAVVALAAVLALAGGLRAARRTRTVPAAGELERALRLAREAESRPPADRRRALGLLARLLGPRDRGLSGTASELAWARPEPEGASLASLVSDVEREVSP